MQYRREIDGLRAVAVIPVILFHAGFAPFAGGFVGVDVFFVISGYLISLIMLDGLERGTFSILEFYERRARRILPALFLVMACCIPFAWMWMLPDQMKDFTKSLVTVTFFVSNVHLWQQGGYFGSAIEQFPLLHTWSLAIEEQYYLFAPLVALVLWRFGIRTFVFVLFMLALGGLAFAEWASQHAPTFNFYFTLSRIWEIMAGALCGFYWRGRNPNARNTASLLGLALIVVSIAVFGSDTRHPSHNTLLPVAGTALVLLYGRQGTLVARFLSSKPFVGIGLVSYSAYLWHQPLFAFARIRSVDNPEQSLMLLLAALSLGLAYLSWRFVERPFRRRAAPVPAGGSRVFGLAAAVASAFVLFGTAGMLTNGFPDRTAPSGKSYAELGITEKLEVNFGLHRDCDRNPLESPNCRRGENPEFALWGDSFAMQLAPAMIASDPDIAMVQYTRSACAPVPDIAVDARGRERRRAFGCIDFNDRALAAINADSNLRTVVIASAFSVFDGPILRRDGSVSPDGDHELAVHQFFAGVEKLKENGKKVVLVSQAPANGRDIGKCLAKVLTLGLDEAFCDFSRSAYSGWVRDHYRLTREFGKQLPVVMLDDMICATGTCDTLAGDIALYRDGAHLSREGSAWLGRRYDFMARLRNVLSEKASGS